MLNQKIENKPESGILGAVRHGFETVAGMARHVRVREDLVPAYAGSLPGASPQNVLDDRRHYSGTAENTAAYILTLDAVNFGSGYKPYMAEEGWKLIDNSIYFTLSTRIKNYFESKGPIPAAELARFEPAQCLEILELNGQGRYSAEFARLCAESLRELGRAIETYGGRYLEFVNVANGSAEKMVELLARLQGFNDVHEYRGLSVPFYKRAQIAAADLHRALGRLGPPPFRDIENLTMFADNAVPHVLRVDGLLEYTPALAERIAAGDNIPSGSEEEVEIRACAGYLVEKIAKRKGMIPMTVDHILWHKSVEDPRYRETPSHRTLSRFY